MVLWTCAATADARVAICPLSAKPWHCYQTGYFSTAPAVHIAPRTSSSNGMLVCPLPVKNVTLCSCSCTTAGLQMQLRHTGPHADFTQALSVLVGGDGVGVLFHSLVLV